MPPIATTGSRARAPRRVAHEIEPDGGVPGVLGRGPEDRTDRHVVDRLAQGRLDLLDGVRGDADDRRGAEQPRARRRGGRSSWPT